MTIDELGSIGELVGAFAVVLSLVYLAVQLRQNTRELRVSSQEANALKFVDVNLAMASNPVMIEVMQLLQTGTTFEELDAKKAVVAHLGFQSIYNLIYQYHSRYKKGLADEEHWDSLHRMLKQQLTPSSLYRSWFKASFGESGSEDNDFVSLMRREICEFEATDA